MEWTSNGPRSNLESGLVPGGRSPINGDFKRFCGYGRGTVCDAYGKTKLSHISGNTDNGAILSQAQARWQHNKRGSLCPDISPHFQFDFGIPTLQRPSASLFIGVQALSGRTEANTQWVKKKTSRFSSPSTDF